MQGQKIGRRREDAVPLDVVRMNMDDEVDLVSLWRVARTRWPWVLAGLLAGLLAGATYLVITAPIYESRASLQIGKVPDGGPIVDIEALTVQLVGQYGPQSADASGTKKAHLKEVLADPRRSNIVNLVSIGGSSKEASDFLKQVVTDVTQRHEQAYETVIQPLRSRLSAIDEKTRSISEQLGELSNLVTRLKQSQPAQAALISMERGRLYVELSQLERDRADLQQRMASPNSNPTVVIVDPSEQVMPVAPRRSTAFAIGVIGGLLLGLLAAFVRESFSRE